MNISSRSLRNTRYDGLKLLTSSLSWIFIIKRNKKRKHSFAGASRTDKSGCESKCTARTARRLQGEGSKFESKWLTEPCVDHDHIMLTPTLSSQKEEIKWIRKRSLSEGFPLGASQWEGE